MRLWQARLKPKLTEILLHDEPDERRLIRRCLIIAAILFVVAYPDVLFRGASLSLANFVNVTFDPRPHKVELFPERPGREAYHGHADAGGSAFQSEPEAQFVKRTIWSGQSLYWNPYSAAGSYGIETLVDVKTSPLSFLTAVLGGSDLAFHAVLLGFSFLSVFCLLVLLAAKLRLCLLAATVGGVSYLLSGFYMPNPGANFAQAWLYFPILALALVSFAKTPRVMSFLGIVGGAGLILSSTFLPTDIVIVGTMLLMGAAAAVSFEAADPGSASTYRGPARVILGQVAGIVLGLIILAVIYLPVAEALQYMRTDDYYAHRVFAAANFFNFISMFTPKHVFEQYNAITPKADQLRGNIVFHQGIIGGLLVLQTVRAWPMPRRIFVGALGLVLLLMLCRVFGVPVLTPVINAVPLFGHIGEQYVWIGISALVTILIAFGAEGVIRGGVRMIPLIGGALLILGSLAYTATVMGPDTPPDAGRYIPIAIGLVAACAALLLILGRSESKLVPGLLLAVLAWGELTFYVNHYRLSRTDRFAHPPPFVRFLRLHLGLHRMANYGHWGAPPEYGAAYGLYEIDDITFHQQPRYEEMFRRLFLPDVGDRWGDFLTLVNARDIAAINLAAFDFLGTKYILVPTLPDFYPHLLEFMGHSGWPRAYEDQYFRIFENPDPLPRAFITHRLVESRMTPIDIGRPPRAVATSDDPALIEQAGKLGISDAGPTESGQDGEFTAISRYDHAVVEIATELRTPGILVLTDTWHPNWHVTVDRQPAHLGVVDGAFRGVVLPPGRHSVAMTYAPRTLFIAKIISLLGLLAAATLLILRRRLDPRFQRLFGRSKPEIL